jgi:hypothetical protein
MRIITTTSKDSRSSMSLEEHPEKGQLDQPCEHSKVLMLVAMKYHTQLVLNICYMTLDTLATPSSNSIHIGETRGASHEASFEKN